MFVFALWLEVIVVCNYITKGVNWFMVHEGLNEPPTLLVQR